MGSVAGDEKILSNVVPKGYGMVMLPQLSWQPGFT